MVNKKSNDASNNFSKIINQVETNVENPRICLPDDIFYFVGRLTPFVNVDFLIAL